MKLGKSLIITGLLFSSVLGSVNVNNITAMAANTGTEAPAPVTPEKKREVSIRYTDDKGNPITDWEFFESVNNPIRIAENATTFNVSELNLPDNYKIDGDKTDFSVALNVNGLDVKVVNVPRDNVKVNYPEGTTNEDGKLPQTLALADRTKQVKANNLLNIPNGYEFDEYKNGEVTLKQVVKKTIEIIFVDENYNEVGKGQLKDKNISETVTENEVNAPDGFKVLNTQQSVIAAKADDKGAISYFARILVKKNAVTNPSTSQTSKKPSGHSHGSYTVQRVRVSFVDQNGDEVGYKQLNGKSTFSASVDAPAGYSLVNSSDSIFKFDKSGNKDIKVKVTKNKPTPVMSEGIVTTNSGEYFRLYTIEGKEITNRGLSGDSKWYTDQYATINGEKMYRVATNEWVKSTDVYK